MANLLLAGYFGCGNLGDDAILLGFLNGIAGKGHEIQTLCGSPDRVMNAYGVRGIPRLDFNEVGRALDDTDALVFPGGSIFQDVTSMRSVAYYYKLVAMAKKRGKKVVMLGQGVGPLNGMIGRTLSAKAFNLADAVVVRDPGSSDTLRKIGYKGMPRLAADPAFLLPTPQVEEDLPRFGVAGMKTVGISVRPFGKDKGKAVIETFAELTRILFSNGWMPVLIEMDSAMDRSVISAIGKANGGKVPEIKNLQSPIDVQKRMTRMDAVIAMRLHAGILASTVGLAPFMVSYDPKVTALTNLLGLPAPPTVENLNAGRIFDLFKDFQSRQESMAKTMETRRQQLVEQARGNIDALDSVLGR